MILEQQIMRRWVITLQKWGIEHWAATFIENGGPFNLLIAQILYISHPLLSGLMPDTKWNVLTQILEQPTQAKVFATLLRESGK